MNINATLFVQIANFIIAYFMIRMIFLRPALSVIMKEEELREELKGDIAKKERTIEEMETNRKQQWQVCHQFFKQHRPTFQFYSVSHYPAKFEQYTEYYRPNELERLTQEIQLAVRQTLKEKHGIV